MAVKSEAVKIDKQNFCAALITLTVAEGTQQAQPTKEIIRYYPTWHSVARAGLHKATIGLR